MECFPFSNSLVPLLKSAGDIAFFSDFFSVCFQISLLEHQLNKLYFRPERIIVTDSFVCHHKGWRILVQGNTEIAF